MNKKEKAAYDKGFDEGVIRGLERVKYLKKQIDEIESEKIELSMEIRKLKSKLRKNVRNSRRR